MSPAQQVEHFERYKDGRLIVVLRFLAGLNKLNCFPIEEIANNFFRTPLTHEDSRYLISSNAAVCVYFVQWLFETQSDDVIEYVLGQKTIEFEFLSGMLSLDYYALGYCISHSKCQWVLGLEEEIDETHLKMLAAGAGTRSEPRGRVVGLRGDLIFMNAEFTLTNLLNWCFTSWRDILHLQQLFLKQPVLCDSISWPDISALRVLEVNSY